MSNKSRSTHIFFGRDVLSSLIDLWPAKCGRGRGFSGDKYRREIFISPRPKTPAAWNLFTHCPWPQGPMIPEENLLFLPSSAVPSFLSAAYLFFSIRRCHATSTKVDRNRAQSKRNRRIDWWNGWSAMGNIFSITNSVTETIIFFLEGIITWMCP